MYVGITYHDDPNVRWKNGNGYSHNPHFTAAIKKYGWDNFSHVIIAEGLSKEMANRIEEENIKKYKAAGNCYNITDGGEGHNGQPIPAETREKISRTLRLKNLTPWNKGKTGIYSDETRQRISESQRGRVSPMKGKKSGPMSDETKAKISVANKGKNNWTRDSKRGPYSEAHRKAISDGLRGLRKGISTGPRSDETRTKISQTRRGYKWVCKQWLKPKQVSPEEFDLLIADGWTAGKLIVHNGQVYKWGKQSQNWTIYDEARTDIIIKSRQI